MGVTLVAQGELEPETAARVRHDVLKHDGGGKVAEFGPRVKGSDVHGLSAYYTDFEKLSSAALRRGQNVAVVTKPHHAYNNDWFMKFRAQDNLPETVIHCTPHVLVDGLSIVGGRLVLHSEKANTDLLTTCTHTLEMPEAKLFVYIHDSRVFLGEWASLETKVRQLLAPLPRP